MSTDASLRNIHHRRRGRIDNQKRFQIETGLFHSETSSQDYGQAIKAGRPVAGVGSGRRLPPPLQPR
jgi:hypothetical protein